MKSGITRCQYCEFAPELQSEKDDRAKKKKCRQSGLKVFLESSSCKQFSPSNYFHCRLNHYRLHIAACLGRRFNTKLESTFDTCRKCKQFDELLPIINSFCIDLEKRPKAKRMISRRSKSRPVRVITRREKHNKPSSRKITRRIK